VGLSGEFRDWEAELDACELDAGVFLLLEDILKFQQVLNNSNECLSGGNYGLEKRTIQKS
jgi:hypothetical protein